MLADTKGLTSHCCFLTQDPVGVARGNNTLYVRHDVITICLFGYDPSTGCQQCLQDYWVSAEYLALIEDANGHVRAQDYGPPLEFNLSFGGPDCSEITGTNHVSNSLSMVSHKFGHC